MLRWSDPFVRIGPKIGDLELEIHEHVMLWAGQMHQYEISLHFYQRWYTYESSKTVEKSRIDAFELLTTSCVDSSSAGFKKLSRALYVQL